MALAGPIGKVRPVLRVGGVGVEEMGTVVRGGAGGVVGRGAAGVGAGAVVRGGVVGRGGVGAGVAARGGAERVGADAVARGCGGCGCVGTDAAVLGGGAGRAAPTVALALVALERGAPPSRRSRAEIVA